MEEDGDVQRLAKQFIDRKLEKLYLTSDFYKLPIIDRKLVLGVTKA